MMSYLAGPKVPHGRERADDDDILHQIVVTLERAADTRGIEPYRERIVDLLSPRRIAITWLRGLDPLRIVGFTVLPRDGTVPVEEAMEVLRQQTWIEAVPTPPAAPWTSTTCSPERSSPTWPVAT